MASTDDLRKKSIDKLSLSELLAEARQLLLELRLADHAVPAGGIEARSAGSDEDIGDGSPTGGVDSFSDHHEKVRQKSAEHFADRLEACKTTEAIRSVVETMRVALDAWQHTRPSPWRPPVWESEECAAFLFWHSELRERGDPRGLTQRDLAEIYDVSVMTINRLQRKLRLAA